MKVNMPDRPKFRLDVSDADGVNTTYMYWINLSAKEAESMLTALSEDGAELVARHAIYGTWPQKSRVSLWSRLRALPNPVDIVAVAKELCENVIDYEHERSLI